MHIARVALRVSELDRCIDWCGRVTGLALRERDGMQATMGAPDGGPIGLDHVRTATRRELRKTGLLAAEKTLDDWPVPETGRAAA